MSSGPVSDVSVRREKRRAAKPEKSEEIWRRILDAASKVFLRIGFADATIDDIAREAGLKRASMYYYVGTKEELLAHILRDDMLHQSDTLDAIIAEDLSAAERLRKALIAYMDALETMYPGIFVYMSGAFLRTDIPAISRANESSHRYGVKLAQLIREGIDAGEFAADIDPDIAVFGIFGMFNWTHRWYKPGGRLALPEIGEQFARIVVAGLRADRQADMTEKTEAVHKEKDETARNKKEGPAR
jgi:AcrR family transcriptional regulator